MVGDSSIVIRVIGPADESELTILVICHGHCGMLIRFVVGSSHYLTGGMFDDFSIFLLNDESVPMPYKPDLKYLSYLPIPNH